ncbi:MAG: hypothetical protein GY757_15615 [bacterium]|nr:hypothetical protein [bacterium]
MTGLIHLGQAFKGIWKKLLLLSLALFVFESIFSVLGTSARIKADMARNIGDIPPMAKKMFGEGFAEALLKYGIIALGYIHPFLLVVCVLYIFLAISQILTTEISSGTIGFTLSKPVSRLRIFLNMAIVIYSGLGLIALSAYSASALGISFLHPQLSPEPFAALAWNLYLLLVFVAGYLAIFAAISDSSKKLFTYGGVILLLFYILNLASAIWKPLDYLSPINPFSYYNPIAMLMGSRAGVAKSILIFAASGAMFTAAAFIFRRLDISSG